MRATTRVMSFCGGASRTNARTCVRISSRISADGRGRLRLLLLKNDLVDLRQGARPRRAVAYSCRGILDLLPGLIERTAQSGNLGHRFTFFDFVCKITMPHFVNYRTAGRNASPEKGHGQ